MNSPLWSQSLQLRPEITDAGGAIDDVQMSLFGALYGFQGAPLPYGHADYYGQITHPSQNLVALLAKIAVRLAAPPAKRAVAPAVFRLDQGMGGGKSHGMVGLWHLAAHPTEFAQTEIGARALQEAAQMAGGALPADLQTPRTVVLACDNMTAGVGNGQLDGPAISLHERFLWRLFRGNQELYQKFAPHYADKSQLAAALSAVESPVLILVDEIMDYIRQLSQKGNADLATRDMAFLKALFDTVNDVPSVAMVVVMISSENDTLALEPDGQRRRTEISDQLDRNGNTATVTSHTDFAEILRRRLFQNAPDAVQMSQIAAQFWQGMKQSWGTKIWSEGIYSNAEQWEKAVERCFPFHPALIDLAEREWSRVTGFQRVRSTISIFAATAYVLQQAAQAGQWTPALVGPGDLPLSSSTVREALLGSGLIVNAADQTNFRQVAATDVVSDNDESGHARELDIVRDADWQSLNPRAAQRMATALFGYSIMGPRSQGRQGATKNEIKSAAFVPSVQFALADADGVLGDLENPDNGLAALEHIPESGGKPARLFLSTRQTVRMLFRANRNSISNEERDDTFAELAEKLLTRAPFAEAKFLAVSSNETGDTAAEILRRSHLDELKTRLVALDPRKFSFLNGIDNDTRQALKSALGVGENPFPVEWASSLVFAVVNTQRRNRAYQLILDYIGWKRVCARDDVQKDFSQNNEARKEFDLIEKRTREAIKAAFQHIVYLGDKANVRVALDHRFEGDSQSALSGADVWKALVDKEKAFAVGTFDFKALRANLQETDFNLPLEDLRKSFWKSPRMPLLGGGQQELQNAIFAAIKDDKLRLVNFKGEEVLCNAPGDINLNSSNTRLALPEPEPSPFEEDGVADDAATPPPTTSEKPAPPSGETATPSSSRVPLSFTVNVAINDGNRDNTYKLFSLLLSALDERASSVQATIKLNVPSEDAEHITEAVKVLGGKASQSIF